VGVAHAGLDDIAAWVRAEHERIDGGGFPRGLAGEEIPLEARILAVADAYEAMIADRAYRAGLDPETAREELRANAGTQFDTTVVEAFLRTLAGSRLMVASVLTAEAAHPAHGADRRGDDERGEREQQDGHGERALEEDAEVAV
jgi:HD-GYP domain-containing protein (c-di-GMP phosphodiesterase class II)